MQDIVGKKVFGISGPGQFPQSGLAGREGTISQFKDGMYWVAWEDGNEEPYSTIEPASNHNGCGVYYKDKEVI